MKKISLLLMLSTACSLSLGALSPESVGVNKYLSRLEAQYKKGADRLGAAYGQRHNPHILPEVTHVAHEEALAPIDMMARVLNYSKGRIEHCVTVEDINSTEFAQNEHMMALVQTGLVVRAAQYIEPTAVDRAVFSTYFDSLTVNAFVQLAHSRSPLLFEFDSMTKLAKDKMYVPVFQELYRQLPSSLEARSFVQYVLMVYGVIPINSVPTYMQLCKKYESVFAIPEAYTPLINEQVISELAQSEDEADVRLLKHIADPALSGVENIQLLCPLMPIITSNLAQKIADKKDTFKKMSDDEKRVLAVQLSIVILIGKDNEECSDIYPWQEIFTPTVAGQLVDFCKKHTPILKDPRLGLPPVVGKYAGLLNLVGRDLIVSKIAKQMEIEAEKQRTRNSQKRN